MYKRQISGCLTAEAVKALSVRVHIEGRRFFAVKGAQAAIQTSLALELHIAAHQLHNVCLLYTSRIARGMPMAGKAAHMSNEELSDYLQSMREKKQGNVPVEE